MTRCAQLGEGEAHAFFDLEVGDMLAVKALNPVLDPGIGPILEPIGQAVLRE